MHVFSRRMPYSRIRPALAVPCFSAASCPRRVCRDPYSIVRLFWTLFRSAPSAARPSSQARASPAASQGPNVWIGSEIVRIAERMQAGTGHAHLVDPVQILCRGLGHTGSRFPQRPRPASPSRPPSPCSCPCCSPASSLECRHWHRRPCGTRCIENRASSRQFLDGCRLNPM